MAIIVPTILETTSQSFASKIEQAQNRVHRIQIDVIEKQFRDNQTLLPENWPPLPTDVHFDIHLMVTKPLEWVDQIISQHSHLIISQIEALDDQIAFLAKIKKVGVKAGLAFDVNTPLSKLNLEALSLLDHILLMAIPVGFAGQKFHSSVLEKIKEIKSKIPTMEIGIDGGIDLESAEACIKAGADVLNVNSFLWSDFENRLTQLQELTLK
ncbi:hypothetical protein GYA49_06020 [Candidatus Beckwithbacteria bacterium]|nr:hypothetical protein [Candidatus Beckwithbacteria bacterium]